MFTKLFKNKKTLIGMIHLPALPGYPEHPGMHAVAKKALVDLETLQQAGFHAALVENDNDRPPHFGWNQTISHTFLQIMKVLKKKSRIPIGMEIIYDMPGTVTVAAKAKADFVRLDVFVDNVQTRYGPSIQAQAEKIVKMRDSLAPNLLLLTDIHVKHVTMLDKKTLQQSAKEAIAAGSDALIITGTWTGVEPNVDDCRAAKKVAKNIPVLIGSGLNKNNINKLFSIVGGGIVGTSIKTEDYINKKKAKELVSHVEKYGGK